ncbi:carboxypeptidase-like regulatory domain-containing protein, partial [Algoriphagus sp. NF]|uniref:carboxypeptidase-like regulatory domain-containing protein n=1 Tax=Algoriphagus sp. NF TaxID=2992756 RepID=UPI00237A188A
MRIYAIILLFILGYSECSLAQTFSFEILNDDTKTPISFAHIQVENELIGTVTDINGRGSVTIPKDFVSRSVIISFIGYASLTISIQSLKAETTNKFFLKESSTDLDEIEVIDIGMDPRDFINSALGKVDETFYTKKYRSIGLYHEKVVEDGDSTFSY